MTKKFKIAAIVVAVILAVLIVLPYAFKGRIIETAKKEINKSVNAKVDFGTFSISLIRNFPNITLRLNDLSVKGVDAFEDVALAEIGSIFVTIDLMSLFRGDSYVVRAIRLDGLEVNVIVLEDGQANWDIMMPAEKTEILADDDVEPFEFKQALQNFEIRSGNITYDDAAFDVYVEIKNLNHRLKGNFTDDFAALSIPFTTADAFTMKVEGVPVITRAYLDLVADIDANFSRRQFAFRENELSLNSLTLNFDGYFSMPSGEDMSVDISFYSKNDDIRSFLSIIPAIYAHEFESMQTSGYFALDGRVNGIMNSETVPFFNINLLLEDGEFYYPDMPESVAGINIKANILNEGRGVDQTIVDISRFDFNMADNPVRAMFNLKTPVSDPQFNLAVNCDIDLSAIGKIFPMHGGKEIKGAIKGDLFAKGKLSLIEQELYDRLEAGGMFDLRNIEYKSSDIEEVVELNELVVDISPRYVHLSSFNMQYGETMVLADGRINNFFGYLLDDRLLSGSFDMQASYVNLNQFKAEAPGEQPEERTGPMEMSRIHIPKNIDFTLNSKIGHVLFGDLDITDIEGTVRVVGQQARMERLNMKMLDGELTVDGTYKSSEPDHACIDFAMRIDNFDIQKSFNTFNTIQTLAPAGKFSHGSFSAALSLNTMLDNNMSPVLETMEGGGLLSSQGVLVEGSPSMEKLAGELKMERLKRMDISDFVVRFTFTDEKLDFGPFDIRFGNSSATISGETYFDQRINYNIELRIPREELGEKANQVISGMVSQASLMGFKVRLDDEIKVDANITGTFTDPRISLSLSDMMKSTVEDVLKQIQGKIKGE